MDIQQSWSNTWAQGSGKLLVCVCVCTVWVILFFNRQILENLCFDVFIFTFCFIFVYKLVMLIDLRKSLYRYMIRVLKCACAQTLIVLRWPWADDRTLKSGYYLTVISTVIIHYSIGSLFSAGTQRWDTVPEGPRGCPWMAVRFIF